MQSPCVSSHCEGGKGKFSIMWVWRLSPKCQGEVRRRDTGTSLCCRCRWRRRRGEKGREGKEEIHSKGNLSKGGRDGGRESNKFLPVESQRERVEVLFLIALSLFKREIEALAAELLKEKKQQEREAVQPYLEIPAKKFDFFSMSQFCFSTLTY